MVIGSTGVTGAVLRTGLGHSKLILYLFCFKRGGGADMASNFVWWSANGQRNSHYLVKR